MNDRLNGFILALYFLMPLTVFAQEHVNAPGTHVNNFSTFRNNEQIISAELNAQTPEAFTSHPEYGILPYNAPCSDCYELIDQRTASTRHFIKNGTNGKSFLSQSALTDLHYKNEKGEWLTIVPKLMPVAGQPGIFQARQQLAPTKLDMVDGYTSIRMQDGAELIFNAQISTYFTSDFSHTTAPQSINRSTYTAGDDGALVQNAFPFIDQELIFGKAKIKSNYILHSASVIDTLHRYFVIEDVFTLPEGYVVTPDMYEGVTNAAGNWHGDLLVENINGIEMARVGVPIVYDSNPEAYTETFHTENISAYSVEQNGNICTLRLVIETAWLSAPERVYPVIIDPTVFGATTTWTGTTGADDAPNWCTVTLSVPTPANATLTGSSIYWESVATGLNCPPSCRLNDLQVQIFTTCDYSPHPLGVWICAGCNVAGTWLPSVDDATTADLVECFTPQCTPFNIDFTINFNQFNCVTPGTCNTSCAYLQEFAVTIEGETLTATALAAGAAAYTVLDCTDQSGWLSASTPNYGVPPYTYTWSPGGYTFSPVYVTFPMGVTVYTLTMTDACGTTVTETVTVTNNCLTLPIELISFSGVHQDDVNVLQWVISNSADHDAFMIERSVNGVDFARIGEVLREDDAQDQFHFIDADIREAIYYYRLAQITASGDTIHSNIIAIQKDAASDHLLVNTYDAETGMVRLTLFTTFSGPANLNLYDMAGKTAGVYPMQVSAGINAIEIRLPELSAGTYLLSARGSGLQVSASLVR